MAEPEADIQIRQIKYLNNIVEQDHRTVKRLVRPMPGFKSYRPAPVTLAGIELMHMIREGQLLPTGEMRRALPFALSSAPRSANSASVLDTLRFVLSAKVIARGRHPPGAAAIGQLGEIPGIAAGRELRRLPICDDLQRCTPAAARVACSPYGTRPRAVTGRSARRHRGRVGRRLLCGEVPQQIARLGRESPPRRPRVGVALTFVDPAGKLNRRLIYHIVI